MKNNKSKLNSNLKKFIYSVITSIILIAIGVYFITERVEEIGTPIIIFAVPIVLLLFNSRFLLDNSVLKPIYISFIIFFSINCIIFGMAFLSSYMNRGGNNDMGGLWGIILVSIAVVTFFLCITMGLLVSYIKTKNKIVLILLILFVVITLITFSVVGGYLGISL